MAKAILETLRQAQGKLDKEKLKERAKEFLAEKGADEYLELIEGC